MKACLQDNKNDEIDDLRQRVQDALNSGITLTRMSVESGVKRDTINLLIDSDRQSWFETTDMVFDRLRQWLDRASTVARITPDPDWVETPTAKEIMEALWIAAERPTISVVYGGAGVGKTSTLRAFRKSRPNVWIITVDDFSRTPVSVLKKVADVIDYRPDSLRPDDLAADVIRVMRRKSDDSAVNGLLVVDEAQHLAPRALEGLRALHDQAGVGLALAGNEKVFARIKGGAQSAHFAQIFSRVGRRLHLAQPKEEDVDAILEAWGVSGVKEREFAQRIAASPGGLRHMVQMIREAKSYAQPGGAEVNLRLLKAAAQRLLIEQ